MVSMQGRRGIAKRSNLRDCKPTRTACQRKSSHLSCSNLLPRPHFLPRTCFSYLDVYYSPDYHYPAENANYPDCPAPRPRSWARQRKGWRGGLSPQVEQQDGEVSGVDPADPAGLPQAGGAGAAELLTGLGAELRHGGVVEVGGDRP